MKAIHPSRKPRSDTYRKVFDSRKRRQRGLWERNGRYFANLTVADDLGRKSSRWVPLEAEGLDEAKADYARLVTERADDRLRPLGLTPTLADYAKVYAKQLAASGKRAATVAKEGTYVRRWSERIGHIRLNKIRPHHLSKFLTALGEIKKDSFGRDLAPDFGGRSINLHLGAIRGLLKAAGRDGHIKPPLPFEGLEWQRVDQKVRQLFGPDDVDRLCEVAMHSSKNGREFVDYLRFLQYSGARRNEALVVRWRDVDKDYERVTIGAEGDSKNREARYVDINPMLEAHLKEMQTRRQQDSQWLFPSPQRGDKDIPAKTFLESLKLARKAAGCNCQDCGRPTVGGEIAKCGHCGSERVEKCEQLLSPKLRRFCFHDLRHHFISYAVMSGLDYMTIARWVGHKDGGILIGKVYGHLADDHRKAQAARMNFGPAAVPMLAVVAPAASAAKAS